MVLAIFLPALVFDVMSSGDFAIIEFRWLMAACVIVVLGSGVIAWPVSRFFNLPWRAFLPSMMFNNCGNLGLPLALLAFGEAGLAGAMVLLLVSNLLHFTLGIYMFGGAVTWLGLLLNPVNLATILGLVFNFMHWQLPDVMQVPINMMGQIVIPMMLISLGIRMVDIDLSYWKIGAIGAIVCPLSGLIFAVIAGLILPLSPEQYSYLILFSALPPAALNFLLSERYQQEPEQVAAMVLFGNAFAAVTFSVVLWWIV